MILFLKFLIVFFILGCIAAFITNDKRHIFAAIIPGIILWIICSVVWNSPVQPLKTYNVTIRAHYLDGHSEIFSRDDVYEKDLPQIFPLKGSFILYFAGEQTPGIVRFEYIELIERVGK